MRHLSSDKPMLGYLYHTFWTLTIGSLLALLMIDFSDVVNSNQNTFLIFGKYILAYCLLRFGIFDFIHNFFAGKHFLYLGDTSKMDKILKKIFKTPTSLMFLYGIKGLFIIAGMMLIQVF